MQFLERARRALAAEARQLSAGLRDRRLALLLGAFAALLLLAAQAPVRYTIQVGQEDGPGSDLPLLDGFHDAEHDQHGDFRWTRERAHIRLPGVGQRALQLSLHIFPVSPEVAERGAHELEVWDNGREVARLPVRAAGAAYLLLLPPDRSGDQIVELRSATFVPSGDQRAIGVPLDAVAIVGGGPALPAWRSTLGWLGAALLAWLALRRAGFEPRLALALLLPGAALAGLAAWLDPPRFALGVAPALIALALGWLLVLLMQADGPALVLAGLVALAAAIGLWAWVAGNPSQPAGLSPPSAATGVAAALLLAGWLRPPLAQLYRRAGPPAAAGAWRWLVLFAMLVLALRYGGKIYPDSMPGDIGFHANRYDALVRGSVLQLSLNRGVAFPYPPALYLLLAPFSLLGLPQRILLQLGGALLDALSPLLVYAIGAAIRRGAPARPGFDPPLVAAAIYAFSAAGFMTTWWNFSTHIFAQFAHLLLIVALVLIWRATSDGRASLVEHRSATLILVVLQSLVYLGHFGFWLNMSLLATIALAALLWAALRGRAPWPAFRLALLAFAVAELLAAVLFYSDYAGLFLDQARATAAGGLTGLAGRASVGRDVLWRTLWDAGLRAHFGVLPLPLALGGWLLLWKAPRAPAARAAALALMAGTFAIALVFASLPFLSGSTLSTRWLMFSLWAVAVGAALGLELLWRCGRAGRLLVIAVAGYGAWITASMWLMALAWRVRPPEPF